VLNPVGPLPAAVYWRRRVLVLILLISVLGGGGWLVRAAVPGRSADGTTTAVRTSPATTPIAQPALERVVPSLASVQTPTAPSTTTLPTTSTAPAAPVPGGPCTDDVIGLQVRAPGAAPAASRPTFELVVTNLSPVPCTRLLDRERQELVMLDATGTRVWGSNDCFPEASDDLRSLAPGEVVSFPVPWSGLSSDPTCTAPRVPLVPGSYVLRGRLDSKLSADAPFAVV